MRNIYDAILDGIDSSKSNSLPVDQFLITLQEPVKALRVAYRARLVYVPYHEEKVQSAYLLTYFPHYYQLIQKIFQERDFKFLNEKDSIKIIFIGGGPGSEAFGLLKYLNERCTNLKELSISILDINASTWKYSHEIVKKELVKDLKLRSGINLRWQAIKYDLTCIEDTIANDIIFRNADLVVFQNCINEVSSTFYPQVIKNAEHIFQILNGNAIFLMIDLTFSVRAILQKIENHLVAKFGPKELISTLKNNGPSPMLSLNATPSELIIKYLLNSSDGLIPRKHLKYDYFLMVKDQILEQSNQDKLGFPGLYKPLQKENLLKFKDVNEKVFVGLDFGTSVTVISYSYIQDGQIHLDTLKIDQKDRNGFLSSSPLVPSAMALNNNQFMLGKHAAELGPNLTFGKNYWDGFKANLGNLSSLEFKDSELRDHALVKISNGKNGLITFFTRLKASIDQKLQNKFPICTEFFYTWSVPANYGITQKNELRECAELAGFDMESSPLVEEPISALINYVFESGSTLEESDVILVLDIGAGTVDVSIVQIEKDSDNINSKLLAVERINEIGGNKINTLMANKLKVSPTSSIPQNKIERFCERLKLKLCKAITTDRRVNFQLPPIAFSNEQREILTDFEDNLSLSFSDFSLLMIHYWQANDGVQETIVSALKKAKLIVGQISKIILTGGGSRNPYIQRFTFEMFQSSEINISDNIQEQVARGNALQSLAQHLFGKNIINPVLHHDIFLIGKLPHLILFEKGTVCPTNEVEVELTTPSFEIIYGDDQLLFESGLLSKSFKAIFYVDTDLELKCEVLFENKITHLNPKLK
ncbi:Hsp70 family protein [Algoriphagus resistens]|uniref:Hsp70 family protein n=1 Tax=Algoriphagus resistens TaxID=1750590 RepID=UPI000716BCCC|nr:Hsp70 family protein [Algoriphagus resistens]